jgi:hypothetical protein
MATHDATLVRAVADRAVYVDDTSSPLLSADEAASRIEAEP